MSCMAVSLRNCALLSSSYARAVSPSLNTALGFNWLCFYEKNIFQKVFPNHGTCGRLFWKRCVEGVLITKGLWFYSEVKLSSLSLLTQGAQGIDHSLNNLTASLQNLSKMEIYSCILYSPMKRGFIYFQRLKDFHPASQLLFIHPFYLHCKFF